MATQEGIDSPVSYRQLFTVPGFSRLAAGGLMARLADAMWNVAIVLFVLQRFHSPTLAGLTVFLGIFPSLVVSPVAGALLDRYGRSRLIALDFAIAFAALALLVGLAASGHLSVALLLPLVTLGGLTRMLSTGGQRSLLPILLPRHFWDRGNALDSSAYTLTSIAGPALAGVLAGMRLGDLRSELALLVSALLYAGAAAVFFQLRDPVVRSSTDASIWHSAWEAVRYVVAHASLRGLALSLTVINIAGGLLIVAVPVLVLDHFHGSAAMVGAIWAIQGISGVAAGLVFGRINSEGRERMTMAIGAFITALAWFLVLVWTTLPVLIIAIAISGLAVGPYDVALFSIRQRRVPVVWFGRAFAVSMSLNFAGFPIGSAIAGPLISVSMSAALGIATIAALLCAVFTLLLIPKVGESGAD
jgi:MFS family permease